MLSYSYYTAEYLCGKEPVIPEEVFLFWVKQAKRKVDFFTFGRLNGLETLPDGTEDCICAVAERLYQYEKENETYRTNGASGPMTSYSNDGQSATFAVTDSESHTAEAREKELYRIVREYLLHTGYLYLGGEPFAES